MLSKNKIKYLQSLAKKKVRDEESAFIAEGAKTVCDIAPYFKCKLLCATPDFFDKHQAIEAEETFIINEQELKQASLLKTPKEVIAVFYQRKEKTTTLTKLPSSELCLALDDVQDPGNLGTILRIADWFGIRHVFCSKHSADAYAPKVIQATMGAIARVEVHEVDLLDFIKKLSPDAPIYATCLDGENLYQQKLSAHGLIVMGNEGNGISEEVLKVTTHKMLIPSYPKDTTTSESLNVAVATAITCAEFRRRQGSE